MSTGAIVDDEYIAEKKANYALFDATISKDMLQIEYDRIHILLDNTKADLDECTTALVSEKEKAVDPNDIRAGKALRSYCSDPTRTEEEKIIC